MKYHSTEESQNVPYSRSVACPWCRAEAGERCVTPSGKERDNHIDRWHSIQRRVRTSAAYFRVKQDDPRFGLHKDDVLLCVNYPYDAKVTVVRREPDGYDPECNVYTNQVEFMRWATEAEVAR